MLCWLYAGHEKIADHLRHSIFSLKNRRMTPSSCHLEGSSSGAAGELHQNASATEPRCHSSDCPRVLNQE